MSLIGGVKQYTGWHLRWQSVTMLVTTSVECLSRVTWSWQISQVAFYCWLRVGQVLVNILMDCHYDSIGRVSAMYPWTISTVWVRYWWCISWLSALPEQFFFQPHNQGFALCYKVHVNWHVVDTITKSWAIFMYRPDISVVCQLMYQLLYRMSIRRVSVESQPTY